MNKTCWMCSKRISCKNVNGSNYGCTGFSEYSHKIYTSGTEKVTKEKKCVCPHCNKTFTEIETIDLTQKL